MGKKKVEVLFALDLYFEDKHAINKASLRKYLEKKIPGLKIQDYRTFTIDKSIIKTEILTNFTSLIKTDSLSTAKPEDEGREEEKGGKVETPPNKLINAIRDVLGEFTQTGKKRLTADEIIKSLNIAETIATELKANLQTLTNENLNLKASLDFLSNSNIISSPQSMIVTSSAMPASPATVPVQRIPDSSQPVPQQMEHTMTLMNKLQEENAKLAKKVKECEDKLAIYERKMDEKVLVEQIKELDTKLKNKDLIYKQEINEFEERIKMLSLEIIEKNDQIKELQESGTDNSKTELLAAKKEIEHYKTILQTTEQKLNETEGELQKNKGKIKEKEEKESSLVTELAKTIEENEKLKNDIKLYADSQNEPRKIIPYIPLSNIPQPKPEEEKKQENTVKPESKTEEKKPETRPQIILSMEDRNKLSNLTAKLAEKEEEITKLMCDLQTYQKQVLNHERDSKVTLMQIDTLTTEKVELMRDLEVLKRSEKETKERMEHVEQEATRKGLEIRQLEQMLDEKNKIIKAGNLKAVNTEEILIFKNKLTDTEKLVEDQKSLLSKNESEIITLRKMVSEASIYKESAEKAQELKSENSILSNKITTLETSIENLKKLLNIANSDTTRLMAEIEDKDKLIEMVKNNAMATSSNKQEIALELEKALKEKNEALRELSDVKSANKKFQQDIFDLQKKVPTESQTLQVAKDRLKSQEEINSLKVQISILERQLSEANIKADQHNKCPSEIQKLTNEINEKNNEITKLQSNITNLEKKQAIPTETPKSQSNPNEALEYLREIVYLYKTVLNNAKERIEEKSVKESRIGNLTKILEEMSDPKMNKDKLKALIVNSLQFFPFLQKFDIKADYKYIVMGMVKVIEHKQTKLAQYKQDKERFGIVLEYSEPKYKVYSDKLNALMSSIKK